MTYICNVNTYTKMFRLQGREVIRRSIDLFVVYQVLVKINTNHLCITAIKICHNEHHKKQREKETICLQMP